MSYYEEKIKIIKERRDKNYWRPDDWIQYNPYLATIHQIEAQAFEDGANAILEALENKNEKDYLKEKIKR